MDLLDQIGFVFLMLKFFERLFSIKSVFHLDLDIFVFYLSVDQNRFFYIGFFYFFFLPSFSF